MGMKKADKGKPGDLSERELETVSGGQVIFHPLTDPPECPNCGEPLKAIPEGFECKNCGRVQFPIRRG